MSFNPNAPNTIGLEYMPHQEGMTSLGSASQGIGVGVVSTAAQTVTGLYLPTSWSGPTSGYGRLWVDTYDLATPPSAGSITELAYKPSSDKSRSNTFHSDFLTSSSLHTAVDDLDDSGPPEATDYIVNANTGGTGTYRCNFNTGAIPNTHRIVYVRFEIRAKGFDWSWQQPTIDLEWWNNTTKLGKIGTISPPQDYVFRTYSFGPYYFDFYNEGSWLQPEIVNLSNSSSRNMGFTLNYACAISRITMIVGVIPENRVAVGVGTKVTVPPSGVQTGQVITMKTPLNVSNWSKANSKTYLHVVRRLEDPFSALTTITPSIPYLDSGSASPHGEGSDYTVSLEDKSGRISSYAQGTATHGLWMAVAGAQSADSMPYWDLDAATISWSTTAAQSINGASVQSYKRLRALIGTLSTLPTQPLCIGLRSTTAAASETWTGVGSWPAQWIDHDGSSGSTYYNLSDRGRMLNGTASFGYRRARLNYSLPTAFNATGEVIFRGVSAANSARIFFAGSTSWTAGVLNSSYELRLTANANLVELVSINGSGSATILQGAAFTFAVDTAYSWRILRLTNGFIGIKVWATAGAEPSGWTFMWIDSTYSGTGFGLGLVGAVDTTEDVIDWDNLAIYAMLATGDLVAADLGDSNIATLRGTIGLTPGSVTFRDCMITFDSAVTLATATTYVVEMASCQNPASPWFVAYLDSAAGHGLTGDITYGGSLAGSGSFSSTGADLALTVGSVPNVLTGLAVTLNSVSLPNGYTSQYAHITWTASSLGASFLRYEIERSEDAGSSWTTIGYVTSSESSHNYFDDYEGARGVATLYRIRVVRSDGAQSDWTTAGSSVTPNAISGVVVFCTNAQPSLTTGYPVLGPETSYKMLNGDKLVLVEMHGRDYQVAFKQSENRGTQWPFEILVHANPSVNPPTGAGIRAFDTLAAIARADAPYLCLLTFDGERLFGALAFPEGVRRYQYTAKVVFTQTAGAPSVVTV